jgi:GR25 family glycosyltransferase involved in LPS biosynthesis
MTGPTDVPKPNTPASNLSGAESSRPYPLWHRLAFHKSGKPRGWLRKIMLKDKLLGTPRPIGRRLLFKGNGTVRPVFAAWYALYDGNPENAHVQNYAEFLRGVIASGRLADAQTVHIVTTRHTEYVGAAIGHALRNTRLQVTRGTVMPAQFDHDLYIVVAPQMFTVLPPAEKAMMVQMEQVRASQWATSGYVARLRDSLAVLDYAIDNIDALIERGLPRKQLYFVPMRPFSRPDAGAKRDIDLLFYGDTSSERRQRYLAALQAKYPLTVVKEVFGDAMRATLDRAKLVVNIHFYEDALLETTRISEALTHGARVVSETATDQGDNAAFASLVDFVPRDDIGAFVARVGQVLADWREPLRLPEAEDFGGMEFHILRALHGIGVLSESELHAATAAMPLPSNRLILSLPEHLTRYHAAAAQRLPGAVPFHGLRNIDGWKGCAASYKFLAAKALAQGPAPLTIYEDDAVFDADAVARLAVIEDYLSAHPDAWDVFSGLLSDLSADARISRIDPVAEDEFIHLDRVIGMVFGIYNRSALKMLSEFTVQGESVSRHAVDRYLEALRPRCITTLRPLAGHNAEVNSSLWATTNAHSAKMIDDSVIRLQALRDGFVSKA